MRAVGYIEPEYFVEHLLRWILSKVIEIFIAKRYTNHGYFQHNESPSSHP
jgi:hypothetical protein